jgi:hypothetical protein
MHLRRTVVLAAAAVLATGTVACGGGDDLPPPPASPAAVAPSSTLDPEHQEILDVYRGSVEAMVTAQQVGDPEHPDLARYFIERTPALLDLQSAIRQNDGQGLYYLGDLAVVTAEVSGIDRDALPSLATIESCLDYTNYQLVNREDDTPVPGAEPLGRHPVTSQAVYGTDNRWYIATSSTDWDATC